MSTHTSPNESNSGPVVEGGVVLPDQVALQPPAERDNEELGGPLGAGRVFQEDQARHCAAEIPEKTHNLGQSTPKTEKYQELPCAPRRLHKGKRCIVTGRFMGVVFDSGALP